MVRKITLKPIPGTSPKAGKESLSSRLDDIFGNNYVVGGGWKFDRQIIIGDEHLPAAVEVVNEEVEFFDDEDDEEFDDQYDVEEGEENEEE